MKSIFVLFVLSTAAIAAGPENTVAVDRKFCYVNTWGSYWASGGRCKYSNDVMVGFDFTSNSAICARMTVECPTRVIAEAEKAVEK